MNYNNTLLGKTIAAPTTYDPSILYPISRKPILKTINQAIKYGKDDWVCYELSWCDQQGCPHTGILTISLDWQSPYIIESKSLKLYLNSFNLHHISATELLGVIKTDLSDKIGNYFKLQLFSLNEWVETHQKPIIPIEKNLDNILTNYHEVANIDKTILTILTTTSDNTTWLTNNFRSNCPVTGQPDWATIYINYSGNTICPKSLYKYLLSYRNHQGFHEQCIENIFLDIYTQCNPKDLTIRGNFTRRGGIDINPIRSTNKQHTQLILHNRQ